MLTKSAVKTKKILVLFGVSLLSFTGFLDATIVSTALPAMQTGLSMSVTQLQWIMNAFFLGLSAFMASAGRVGDLYGRRKVLYLGTLVFAFASLGAGFAVTPEFLILCRVLQGLTTAITIPVGIALIQAHHEIDEIPKVMGIFGSITGAGLALGPIVGGALVALWGWPAVFFVNIPFILIGLGLCSISVTESRSEHTAKLDYWGMLFLTLTIASLVFGMVEANTYGWSSLLIITSFIVAFFSLLILIAVEKKAQAPILAGYLFTHRVFISTMVFSFVAGGAMAIVLFINPLYLQLVLNQSDIRTGAILFIIPFVVVSAAYAMGYLNQRYGAKSLLIAGALAYFVMSLLHMLLGVELNYVLISITFIIMGLGWAIANTVPGAKLGVSIHGDHLGVAMGALFSFYNIGAAVMLALSVSLFHVVEYHSLVAQFSQHQWVLSNIQLGLLHDVANQPDKMMIIMQQLGITPSVALPIMRQAFMVAMHSMFYLPAIFALIALGIIISILKKDKA